MEAGDLEVVEEPEFGRGKGAMEKREDSAEGSDMEDFEETHIVRLEQDMVFLPFFSAVLQKMVDVEEKEENKR